MVANVLNSNISTAHRLISKGHLTASQLLDLCLQRIRLTQKLNAFITVNESNAKECSMLSNIRYKSGKL